MAVNVLINLNPYLTDKLLMKETPVHSFTFLEPEQGNIIYSNIVF